MNRIRNFSIIAHIDHGKSTLADRFLEVTKTIEKRKMREQVLDSMELERERGITIKMQPVRMQWTPSHADSRFKIQESGVIHESKLVDHKSDEAFILNLIDTPGHIDFSYEVSRALSAVEGAILLVDATQGVQAQTFTTLRAARELGLTIIPAVSKIDSPLAMIEETKAQIANLLKIPALDILECSGKTGKGVPELLRAVIERIPPPQTTLEKTAKPDFRGLIFDFQYSDHRGVIIYTRVFDGAVRKGDSIGFASSDRSFTVLEVGTFSPDQTQTAELVAGSIGYIVTGIKEPGIASVGDTLRSAGGKDLALPGFRQPKPVVWASFYPESQDDFPHLRQALLRLRLSDSSLTFEEETSGTLGRGFRCGFLGMLHLEIITERLKREFNIALVVTMPTITYEVEIKDGKRKVVYSPALFPEYGQIVKVWEPLAEVELVTPPRYLGDIMQLFFEHEAAVKTTNTFGEDRVVLKAVMPLRELMRNFFDRVKTVSSGYASVSYELGALRQADVVRLDLHAAGEMVPAFTRIVSKARAYEDGVALVDRLYNVLPRQLFTTKIQAVAMGRILASHTLPAMRKDVTGYLYGGDRTRKMKLWAKQKKGKKRLQERGKINIPQDVFLKMIKGEGEK